jgi:hypothetical protein
MTDTPIYTASDAKRIMAASYRDGYLAALLSVQKACEKPAGTRETISDKGTIIVSYHKAPKQGLQGAVEIINDLRAKAMKESKV